MMMTEGPEPEAPQDLDGIMESLRMVRAARDAKKGKAMALAGG
jgi:hypothetical protein